MRCRSAPRPLPIDYQSVNEQFVPGDRCTQVARLPTETLRWYQSVGLIEPDWTDASTSFSYYRWRHRAALEQENTATRDFDQPTMPTHRGDAAPHHDSSGDAHDGHRSMNDRASPALAVMKGSGFSDLGHSVVDEVYHRSFPTLTLTAQVRADRLATDVATVLERLHLAARDAQIDTRPSLWGEYPVALSDEFSFTAHLPLHRSAVSRVASQDLARLSRFGAGRFARTVHRGPIGALPFAYRALLTKLGRSVDARGAIFERYHIDLSDPVANEIELLYKLD